jgi:UbiD family decarboxylase
MRGFLEVLQGRNDLFTVNKPVSPKFEVAAYVRKSSDTDGPAFIFEEIDGYPRWRIAAALYATPRRMAAALGCSERETSKVYARAVRDPIPPTVGSGRGAPCKELVWTGADADLGRLPIVTHSEDDAGPYITSDVDVAKDPETGVRGLGISRLQVTGPRRLGINSPPERRIGRFHLKAEEKGHCRGQSAAASVQCGASGGHHPHPHARVGIGDRKQGDHYDYRGEQSGAL